MEAKSRMDMEADPITWFTSRRGPSEVHFHQWAEETGYYTVTPESRQKSFTPYQIDVRLELSV